jgi:excisionase family DNA binding protein
MSDDFGAEFWAAVTDRATQIRARINSVLDREMAQIDAAGDDETVADRFSERGDFSHTPPPVDAADDYMTPGEAAQFLHVSPKTINRWANDSRIPCTVTLGGHRRFRRRDVETAARQMSQTAAGRSPRPGQARLLERFSEGCRQTVRVAQNEARLLHHGLIGDEHVLLGVMQDDQGVAGQALASLGISLEAARRAVKETIRPVDAPTQGSPQFTSGAKKMLGLALREALQLGDNHIGTEHLLLAMAGDVDSMAAQTLLKLGADLEQLRDHVLELVSGDLLTVDEAAQHLHVSPKTITRWANDGRVRHIETPDGQRRFRRNDIETRITQVGRQRGVPIRRGGW